MQQEAAAPVAAASEKWWVMLGVGLGVLMSTLDGSIVNLALPTLQNEYRTSFPLVQWVVLSYSLMITSLTLGVARLGDMISRKRLYLGGLAVFTVGSVLCAVSPTIGALIAFRALQGVGAVVVTALAMAIVTAAFPARERGRAAGVIGAVVSLGIALGPSVGGLIIDRAGWPWLFLINLPLGLIALFIVWRTLPEGAPGRSGQRFDGGGAVLLGVTLLAYALGMTLGQEVGFGSAGATALLLGSLAGLVGFLLLEARVPEPMIDLRLFRNGLLGLNLLISLLVFVVIVGYAFLMPFFLERVQNYGPAQTGLMIALVPVLMGIIAPFSGLLSDRLGAQGIIFAGLLLLAAGCLTLSTLTADVDVTGYLWRTSLIGVGFGVFQSPSNSAVMGTAPRDRLGVVSGLLSLSRTLGQSTGFPLMGALFVGLAVAAGGPGTGGDLADAPPAALVAGIAGTFRVAALLMLATAVVAAVAWRGERRALRSARR